MAGEEVRDGGVEKLGAIVGLHGYDGEVELGAGIGNKVNDYVGRVRLRPERKSPHVMRVVIDDNEIVFKTRIAKNGRCPQITMN